MIGWEKKGLVQYRHFFCVASLGWLLIGVNEDFLEVTNHESGAHLEQRYTLKFKLLHRSACQQWFVLVMSMSSCALCVSTFNCWASCFND